MEAALITIHRQNSLLASSFAENVNFFYQCSADILQELTFEFRRPCTIYSDQKVMVFWKQGNLASLFTTQRRRRQPIMLYFVFTDTQGYVNLTWAGQLCTSSSGQTCSPAKATPALPPLPPKLERRSGCADPHCPFYTLKTAPKYFVLAI